MRTLTTLLGLTLVLGSATAMAADSVPHSASSASFASMSSASLSSYSSSSLSSFVSVSSHAAAVDGVVSKKADNTELNTRDKNDNTLTPQKQTNSKLDRETLAAVRRAIIDDSNLSMSAHNVKILVLNGVVTLRGPVKSENEKVRVEALARKVAAVTSVDNQLDIDLK